MRRLLALLALVLLAVTAVRAGCGVSLSPLRSHFPNVDNRGALWLHHELFTVTPPDGGAPIPVHAYWSPDGTRPGSLLGEGWRAPLLEARCVQVNKDTLRVWTPDGYLRDFEIEPVEPGAPAGPRKLRLAGWAGEMDAASGRVEIAASCGARLVFRAGRIAEMTLDGRRYTWQWASGRLTSLSVGDKPVLTLDYGASGTLARFAWGAGRTAEVLLGDVVSSDGAKPVVARGLTGLRFDDGAETRFAFESLPGGLAAVTFPAASRVEWEIKSRKILRDGDWAYQVRLNADAPGSVSLVRSAAGKREIYYNNPQTGVRKETQPDGSVRITTKVVTGPAQGMPRSVQIERDGKLELIESCNYDNRSRVVMKFSKNNGIIQYYYNNDGMLAKIKSEKGTETAFYYDTHLRLAKSLESTGSSYNYIYEDSDRWAAVIKNYAPQKVNGKILAFAFLNEGSKPCFAILNSGLRIYIK